MFRVERVATFTSTLRQDQITEMRKLSVETDTAMSLHVRRAIDEYLQKRKAHVERVDQRDPSRPGCGCGRGDGEDPRQLLLDYGGESGAVDPVPGKCERPLHHISGRDLRGAPEGRTPKAEVDSAESAWAPQSYRKRRVNQDNTTKVTFTTSIRPDQAEKLRDASQAWKVPIAEHVRRALDIYLTDELIDRLEVDDQDQDDYEDFDDDDRYEAV